MKLQIVGILLLGYSMVYFFFIFRKKLLLKKKLAKKSEQLAEISDIIDIIKINKEDYLQNISYSNNLADRLYNKNKKEGIEEFESLNESLNGTDEAESHILNLDGTPADSNIEFENPVGIENDNFQSNNIDAILEEKEEFDNYLKENDSTVSSEKKETEQNLLSDVINKIQNSTPEFDKTLFMDIHQDIDSGSTKENKEEEDNNNSKLEELKNFKFKL